MCVEVDVVLVHSECCSLKVNFIFIKYMLHLEKLWDVKYYGKNYDETHVDFKSGRTEIVAAKLGH